MKKEEIYKILDEIAPLRYAEAWDNCGVQIEIHAEEVSCMLCALEINDAVIDEALAGKADLILTHHPLFFDGLRSLDTHSVPARYAVRLVQAGISVYSIHTCYDAADGGMNDHLASIIGLQNVQKTGDAVPGAPEAQLLRVGDVHEAMPLREYAAYLRSRLQAGPGLRVAGDPEKIIRRVCVCGGSGSGMWRDALAAGADLYLSGDIKHHDAAAAVESGLAVADATHAGTECWFAQNIARLLKPRLKNVTVLTTESEVNPFSFQTF